MRFGVAKAAARYNSCFRSVANHFLGTPMISAIKGFLSQLVDRSTKVAGDGKALQVATAALLVEMMRSDKHIAAEEQALIEDAVRALRARSRRTQRPPEACREEATQAVGYYPFLADQQAVQP